MVLSNIKLQKQTYHKLEIDEVSIGDYQQKDSKDLRS